MEIDFYGIGFVPGVPINGGHWYGDPFGLFTDYGIENISQSWEPYPIMLYSAPAFFVISPEPSPVPEPSSLILFCLGLLLTRFNKRYSSSWMSY